MLSIFKRKPLTDVASTFKARVQRFWTWYSQVAERFHEKIQSGDCKALAEEVSANVHELGPGFAWVFGPGENGKGHSFTLTGEGNLHRQLLASYWQEQAPKLDGWTFYAARQPGSIEGIHIDISGRRFDPLEFWLTPAINEENERLDITVWHPQFDVMPERERGTVLFLFLDEVLGEYGTEQWIGRVNFNPKRLTDSIPLQELCEVIKNIQTERGWKKLPPGERAVVYRFNEPHARFLRGDILTGTTIHPRLLQDYVRAEGQMQDPLRGTGADYVYIAFAAQILPAGSQAETRGEIENQLNRELKASRSGRSLGGAWGTENAYIDLLLFDGSASLEIVRRVLRERGLPSGTSINYFAKEKRGHRILL